MQQTPELGCPRPLFYQNAVYICPVKGEKDIRWLILWRGSVRGSWMILLKYCTQVLGDADEVLCSGTRYCTVNFYFPQ